MNRQILFFCMLLISAIAGAQIESPVSGCYIRQPEKIIVNYQPTDDDLQVWFQGKGSNVVTQAQKDYVLHRLKPENRSAVFQDAASFSASKASEWEKLDAYIAAVFTNKKYSKERLLLVCVSYWKNTDYGFKPQAEGLPLEASEFFVMPESAVQSWRYKKEGLPKYMKAESILYETSVMADHRPQRGILKYLRTNYTYYDAAKFSDSTRKNLKRYLADDLLYNEMLDMGQLSKTYHDWGTTHKTPMVIDDPNGWVITNFISYHLGSFTDDKGQEIEIIYATDTENDEMMQKIDRNTYRGSTNGRDTYYFVKGGTADDIGNGHTLSYALARIIRKMKDGFKGWEENFRGYYEAVKPNYAAMGSETADNYAHALIGSDRKSYYLQNGAQFNREDAEAEYKRVKSELDTIHIVRYGRLEKVEAIEERKAGEGNITEKYTLYRIKADGRQYGVLASFTKYNDKLYFVGVEVIDPE